MATVSATTCKDKSAQLCLLVIMIVVIAGIFAPWLAPHDPTLTSIRLKFGQ